MRYADRMSEKMKNKFKLLYACALVWVLACCLNYEQAVNACKYSEGTDSAIEETLYNYGFDCDAFGRPTALDFITAPIDAAKR